MTPRSLAHAKVHPIGLGCMNLSHAYGVPPPADAARALLHRAFDLGVDHFDTAALYGFGANESLVGPVLAPRRSQLFLASKGGLAGETFPDGVKRVIDGRPETIRRHCEASLKRLGAEVLDLYYLHRWDKKVPIEDSVGAMSDLVRRGHVRALGLSEVSATTLKKAQAVHPIAAVQSEYSLWSRNAEIAVLDTCRQIGATFVAFSPLARAFLTDTLHDVGTLVEKDIRRGMPRFQPATYAENLRLLAPFKAIASEVGCTPAQLAIAGVLAQGEHVVVIPGTSNIAHLEENMGAAAVRLTADHLARLESLFAPSAIAGPRYSAASQAEVDTEEYSPDARMDR
jgi:aryl-alcohol dehydrogenase-like predicted oxidoreductase